MQDRSMVIFSISWYTRTPENETADLSQSHAGHNLSQFQADYLLGINLSTAIKNI